MGEVTKLFLQVMIFFSRLWFKYELKLFSRWLPLLANCDNHRRGDKIGGPYIPMFEDTISKRCLKCTFCHKGQHLKSSNFLLKMQQHTRLSPGLIILQVLEVLLLKWVRGIQNIFVKYNEGLKCQIGLLPKPFFFVKYLKSKYQVKPYWSSSPLVAQSKSFKKPSFLLWSRHLNMMSNSRLWQFFKAETGKSEMSFDPIIQPP